MSVRVLDCSVTSEAFPARGLINPLCAHVVFERSTDGDDTIYLELFLGGPLERVAMVLVTERQEKLSVNT